MAIRKTRGSWEKLPVQKAPLTPDAAIIRRECAQTWEANVTRMAEDLEVNASTMRNYITGSSAVPYDVLVRCCAVVNARYMPDLGREVLPFDLRMPVVGSHYVDGQFVEPGTPAHEIISAVLERLREENPHCHDPLFTTFRLALDPLTPMSGDKTMDIINKAVSVQGEDPKRVSDFVNESTSRDKSPE